MAAQLEKQCCIVGNCKSQQPIEEATFKIDSKAVPGLELLQFWCWGFALHYYNQYYLFISRKWPGRKYCDYRLEVIKLVQL